MNSIAVKLSRPREERPSSESFFDWTSSEDESDIGNLPVIRRAKSAQVIRANLINHGKKTPERFYIPSSEVTVEEPTQDVSGSWDVSLKELGAQVSSSSSSGAVSICSGADDRISTKVTTPHDRPSDDFSIASAVEEIEPHNNGNISTDIFQILAAGPPVTAVLHTSVAIHRPRHLWRSIFGREETAKPPTISSLSPESQHIGTFSEVPVDRASPDASKDGEITITPHTAWPLTQQDSEKLSVADKIASKGESVFVDLALTNNTRLRCTVQISLNSNINDEDLFRQLKLAYSKHLLGWSRVGLLCIRRIAYVTIRSEPERFSDSQSILFLRNFANPRRVRGQIAWTSWLARHSRGNTCREGDFGINSRTIDSESMTKSRPDEENGITNCPRICVQFTHAFNFFGILVLFLATWSTVALPIGLWIAFGVPRTYNTPTYMNVNASGLQNSSEELRIIAGFMLGLIVLLVLTMFDLCLIAGGWILL